MLNKIVFADTRCRPGRYWATLLAMTLGTTVVNVAAQASLEPLASVAIAVVWALASTYVWLCVCAARYRDTGFTGWWAFVTLIPLFGWLEAIALGLRETHDE
ncbi:MAG: DUF805 domain-containing protein [Chloroflexi bacterium]|nr:DUF805 domain-containing protein [Chloroflexota bacterium]